MFRNSFLFMSATIAVVVIFILATFVSPTLAQQTTMIEIVPRDIIDSGGNGNEELFPGDVIGEINVVTIINYQDGTSETFFSEKNNPIVTAGKLQSFVSPTGGLIDTVENRFVVTLPNDYKIQSVEFQTNIGYCNESEEFGGVDLQDPDLNCINPNTEKYFADFCGGGLSRECEVVWDEGTPVITINPNDVPNHVNLQSLGDTQFVMQSKLTITFFNEKDGMLYSATNENYDIKFLLRSDGIGNDVGNGGDGGMTVGNGNGNGDQRTWDCVTDNGIAYMCDKTDPRHPDHDPNACNQQIDGHNCDVGDKGNVAHCDIDCNIESIDIVDENPPMLCAYTFTNTRSVSTGPCPENW